MIYTAVKVKDFLEACRDALTEVTAIEKQIERLMPTGAPADGTAVGIRRAKVPGREEYILVSNTNHPQAARAQAIEGYMAALDARRANLVDMLSELEKLLVKLPDSNSRAILRYYYGIGWTDERIADEMETVRQVINRQRNCAIERLEKMSAANDADRK